MKNSKVNNWIQKYAMISPSGISDPKRPLCPGRPHGQSGYIHIFSGFFQFTGSFQSIFIEGIDLSGSICTVDTASLAVEFDFLHIRNFFDQN